jgi:imidazolonepropionase-like amidohydrolase
VEDGIGEEGADGNAATDPITPQLRAIDGLNPFDPCFAEARNAGVTTVVTVPGQRKRNWRAVRRAENLRAQH